MVWAVKSLRVGTCGLLVVVDVNGYVGRTSRPEQEYNGPPPSVIFPQSLMAVLVLANTTVTEETCWRSKPTTWEPFPAASSAIDATWTRPSRRRVSTSAAEPALVSGASTSTTICWEV